MLPDEQRLDVLDHVTVSVEDIEVKERTEREELVEGNDSSSGIIQTFCKMEAVQAVPVQVELEGMLRGQAELNGATLSKRDMALGFMQTLILKNEDIVQVEQQQFNREILLSKGPQFYG